MMQKQLQSKLPKEWVERIFMRLHGRFGNTFFDKFRIGEFSENNEDLGILNAKYIWSEELAHLSAERLKKGLSANFEYAPSCDEFKRACMPVPNCHRDSSILALPKPKADSTIARKNLENIQAMLKIKEIPA